MTAVVCDASIIFKLLVPEPDSDRAETLLESSQLTAPEIVLAEVANVIWSRVRGGSFDAETGQALLDRLFALGLDWHPLHAFVPRALAMLLDHPIYDCIYLALAESLGIPLVTADARFISAVRRTRLPTVEVRPLTEA